MRFNGFSTLPTGRGSTTAPLPALDAAGSAVAAADGGGCSGVVPAVSPGISIVEPVALAELAGLPGFLSEGT